MSHPWSRPFRMIQANLRKIDAADLDVGDLLDRIREHGGDATLANAGGLVAWYPTALPFQRRNEHLSFDFVGELLDGAKRRDIRVLLRLDASKQYDDMYGAHRDWFCHDRDGQPIRHWDMLTTCWNGPYWGDCNFQILDEILSRYEPHGIFYNAYHYTACFCENCRRSFRDFSGMDLPVREKWDDPVWRRYVRWRYHIVEEMTHRLQRHIHARRPGTALSVLCLLTFDQPERLSASGWSGARMTRITDLPGPEAFDNLGRPLPKWIYLGGEEASIGLACGKRVMISLTYSEIFAARRSAQPAAQLAFDIMHIAAHGGNPNVALSGTFDQNDRKALPMFREAYRFLERNASHYESFESVSPTAVTYSQTTMDFYGRGASRERALFEYRGVYEALTHAHRPFDVVADLDEQTLGGYRTLVLPNVACLSEEEIATIDRFVEAGGRLLATHESSFYDQDGQARGGPGLGCLNLGVRDRRDMTGSYLTVTDRELLPSLPHTDLVALNAELIRFEARDPGAVERRDLAATEAVTNNTPEFAAWSATTGDHGLVVLRKGAGKVAYLPWPIGRLYHTHGAPEHRSILADVVDFLCGGRDLETDAPASVSVTVALTTGERLECRNRDGFIEFRVPRVDVYEVVAIR